MLPLQLYFQYCCVVDGVAGVSVCLRFHVDDVARVEITGRTTRQDRRRSQPLKLLGRYAARVCFAENDVECSPGDDFSSVCDV